MHFCSDSSSLWGPGGHTVSYGRKKMGNGFTLARTEREIQYHTLSIGHERQRSVKRKIKKGDSNNLLNH